MSPLYDYLDEWRFSMGLLVWGGLNIGLFEWGALGPGFLQTLAWVSLGLMFGALAIPLADSISAARWHRYLITQPRGFRFSHLGPIALTVAAFLGFVGIRATGVSEFMARHSDSGASFFYWLHFAASMSAMVILQPQPLVLQFSKSSEAASTTPIWLRRVVGSPSFAPLETQTPAGDRLVKLAKRMGWTKPDS